MALTTFHRTMLVVAKPNAGLQMETAETPYNLIFNLLNNGLIGDGAHGSESHEKALLALKAEAERVLDSIASTCNGRECFDYEGGVKHSLDCRMMRP